MKRCKIIIPSVLGMVLLIGFSSCEKLDYGTRIANFADVFFIDKTQNVNLDVKYEGHPIKWDKGAGKIRTLEGEGNFEFYDKITGKVLANRKVNVKAGSPESYLVFQPTESEPISFLDPNGQAAVSTPEPGFMKIKVANFAPNLLPFSKIDLIVYGFVGRSYVKVGTIENVGQSLDNEEYHLVSKGDVLPSRPNYQFSFVDHVTKQEIKNSGGTNFTSPVFSDRAKKGIYTLYLLPQETFENPFYIKYGDNYYGLTVNVLFAD